MAQDNTKRDQRRAKRAEAFKNQKIESAKDFNFDQYNRGKVEGTHISGQEVKHLRSRHGEGGGNLRDTYSALQAQQEAGATFGKAAQRQFDRMGARIDKLDARKKAKEKAAAAQSTPPADQEQDTMTPAVEPDTQDVQIPTPGNTGNQENETNVDQRQSQEVNQDNDINTNITGDGNTVNNNQDNSVRNYGGNQTSLVINNQNVGGSGGGGVAGALDGVATAGTLAGIWDADDSPAGVAKRLDMHQDLNAQAQKKYADTSSIAQGAINRANANSSIDTAGLDERIRGREQNSYDRAALMSKSLWGDLANMNFNWTPNKPAEKPKDVDFDKMTENATDF